MRFTVLTATYNRAHLLGRVYDGLCAQTFRDFEWVIVDDGSSDGTKDLVSSWKSFFPIHYVLKVNGGKHTAVNMGVQQAAGDFVTIIDSDDRLLPHTLERFDFHWKQIPNPDRFSALAALCYKEDGATILGNRLPRNHVDAFTVWDNFVLSDADRCGIVRTDILRKFPYPVFTGERDMLEGVVWNRIFRRYGVRYVDEPLRIAGYAHGGLSTSGDRRYAAPKGAVLYHSELALDPKMPLRMRLKAAINALRFSAVVAVNYGRGKYRGKGLTTETNPLRVTDAR